MNAINRPEWKRFGDAVRHRRRDGGQLQDDRRQTNAFSGLGSCHFEQLGKLAEKQNRLRSRGVAMIRGRRARGIKDLFTLTKTEATMMT